MAITQTNQQITSYRILDATIKTADIEAAAVTGAKLPDDAVGYFETAAEVTVAYTDFAGSPIQLLALDASNDRLVMVQAIATISAEGGPEWDVGSEILDTQAAFADIGSGVWVAGERWTGFCLLPANQKLNCTLTTAGTAGAIKFRTVVMIPKVQTAQIADAAVTSPKLDESTVQYAEVEISSAEILGLFTTAKELVATPGAGKVLEFISLLLAYDYGATAYTIGAATNLEVKITDKTGAAVSTTQAVTGMIDQATDQMRMLDKLEASETPVDAAVLCLALAGADPTLGDGVIHAKVAYRVLATGL